MKDTANYLPNESTMKDMKGLKEGPALAPEEYDGVIFTDFVFFMMKSCGILARSSNSRIL